MNVARLMNIGPKLFTHMHYECGCKTSETFGVTYQWTSKNQLTMSLNSEFHWLSNHSSGAHSPVQMLHPGRFWFLHSLLFLKWTVNIQKSECLQTLGNLNQNFTGAKWCYHVNIKHDSKIPIDSKRDNF